MNEDITYYPDNLMCHVSVPRIMGTKFDMLVLGISESAANHLWRECKDILERIDHVADRFNPTSEISAINRAEPVSCVPVSNLMREMLNLCADYCRRTEGIFDVTIGDHCNFQYSPSGDFVVSNTGARIDFGGFAKGYALQLITDTVRAAGVKNAYIDFGRSTIMGIGHHPSGSYWSVGVVDPYINTSILREVHLYDTALSTSGNTPTYNTHIIDPASGMAITGKRLSAVVCRNPLDAEVLSTTWMIADDNTRARILHNFNVEEEFVYIG